MGVMPYQLEKGLFPFAVERYFNEGLETATGGETAGVIVADAATFPGPHRRLRAIWRYGRIAQLLKTNPASARPVTPENSFVYSGIFTPTLPIPGLQRIIAEDWFGMTPSAGSTLQNPKWTRPDPSAWNASKTTGMWNGYYGNVELIVCETLQRMLEVSLGIPHPQALPAKGDEAAFEKHLAGQATRVWPVYLFLTCPKPWFEGWVTWQSHAATSPVRGQVTVILATPGHRRPATPSPIDLEDDHEMVPVENAGGVPVLDAQGNVVEKPNPYYLRGRMKLPYNSGYDGRWLLASTGGVVASVAGTDPVNALGAQGMWVITHVNHDSAIVWNNFVEPDRPNWNPNTKDPSEAWDLPPIANYRPARWSERADIGGMPSPTKLTGFDDIVVVQPASLDGGIP